MAECARGREAGLDAAAAFVATVPPGRWTTYGDVAVAAGRSGPRRVWRPGSAAWVTSSRMSIASSTRTVIRPAWTPAGDGLPANAREVEDLLL